MKIFSILLGMGVGFVMALVLLYGMIWNAYTVFNTSYYLVVVIGVVLPFVLDSFGSKGFDTRLARICMCLTSFIIFMIYMVVMSSSQTYVSNNSNLTTVILEYAVPIHVLAILASLRKREVK